MPIILNNMPFLDQPSELAVRGERVPLRANQIILWVTLSLRRVTSVDPLAIPFPTILDTGYTHTFSIHERHLVDWAGIQPEALISRAAIRDRGQRVLLREANIWLHPNVRGSRERYADGSPHLITANKGIAIYPGNDFPRLPLLGLRAIAENGLVLKVDGPKRQATLRTPYHWWKFF